MALQLKAVKLALEGLSNRAPETIASIISDFLVSDMPLSNAIALGAAGSTALVDFVWLRSLRGVESSHWSVAKLLQTDANYYQLQFSVALVQAIRRADLSLVQWILRRFSACPVDKQVVEEAAKGGHLWALQLLEEDPSHAGIEWGHDSLTEAAKEGHWHIVHWLHQRVEMPRREEISFKDSVADYAFKQNNLRQLMWAMAHGFDLSEFARPEKCTEEQRAACWETVRYLLELGHASTRFLVEGALALAAKFDDVEFTRWLLSLYVTGEEEGVNRVHNRRQTPALEAAGRYGRTGVLEVLLEHLTELGLPHDPSKAMVEAAKYGKLDVVRWLVEHYSGSSEVDLFRGLPHQERPTNTTNPVTVMDIAASHGHLEILKYLHHVELSERNKRKRGDGDTLPDRDRCRRCTATAMNVASSNGQLEVVKWLHSNRNEGCTTIAMNGAAANGHLDVVKWLHVNRSEGCTYVAMDSAASRYFRVSLCCGNLDRPRQYYEPNSFVKNQLSVVQWLHANRTEGSTRRAMDGAAANGNFEMVKWLHENTAAPCSEKAIEGAAARGRLDIVMWLREYRAEVCSATAMSLAAAGGHLHVLKYLLANVVEGCPPRALDVAVHGDLDVLAWIYVNRSKRAIPKEMNDISHGHLKVVQWLLQHCEGLNIESAMERAIVCKELEIVCYLDTQRTDHSVTVEEMRARLRDSSPYALS